MLVNRCEPEAWLEAIERLRGYQAIRFSDAFELLGGTEQEANPTAWEGLLELLAFFGYEWKWMRRQHDGFVEQLFVREPWPGDNRAWKGMGMTAYTEA